VAGQNEVQVTVIIVVSQASEASMTPVSGTNGSVNEPPPSLRYTLAKGRKAAS